MYIQVLVFCLAVNSNAQYSILQINFDNRKIEQNDGGLLHINVSNPDSIRFVSRGIGSAIQIGQASNTDYSGFVVNLSKLNSPFNDTLDFSISYWGKKNEYFLGGNKTSNDLMLQIASYKQTSTSSVPVYMNFSNFGLQTGEKYGQENIVLSSDFSGLNYDPFDWHMYTFTYSKSNYRVEMYMDTTQVGLGTFTGLSRCIDSSLYLYVGYRQHPHPGFGVTSNLYDEILIVQTILGLADIRQRFTSLDTPTSLYVNKTIQNKSNIRVSPNPCKEKLDIQLSKPDAVFRITIMDIHGQIIDDYRSDTQTSIISLDVDHLKSGIYILCVSTHLGAQYIRLKKE